MLIFGEFSKTPSDQNIQQNTPNCTTFLKFSRGSYHVPLNSPSICVQLLECISI